MMKDQSGMVKLIYSSTFDSTIDVGMRIVEDPSRLTKSAATIFGCDYDELVPDKDHVGLHIVALGDFEHYGSNRNGDGFPKKACVAYHKTFVKNGNVYRHHRNKDPEKRLGQIVKSAYNEPMGRIELFIHAHKDKAQDELHKLATEGDIPFSMACKVAYDRCSVCGTLRRSSKDDNQCDHVRFNLGKVAEDGKVVCTHNDEPNFFDISFVTRPADRIAWHLKAASDEVIDSVKLAEAEELWVPDHIAIASADAQEKFAYLKKIAEAETLLRKLAGDRPKTAGERYFWELRKAAAVRVPDTVISELRKYEPERVFHKLARHGILMDVDAFFKYAMGPEYDKVALHMDGVRGAVSGIYSRMLKQGACQEACNERLFDVDLKLIDTKPIDVLTKAAADLTVVGPEMEQRIIESTINKTETNLDNNDEIGSNGIVEVLAAKYAAYKLSAVKAIAKLHQNTDADALSVLAAAQNMVSSNRSK